MVIHRQSIKPIPSQTQEIARKAFPKGNLYMTLRDKLGTFYNDEDFAERDVRYSGEAFAPAIYPSRSSRSDRCSQIGSMFWDWN